MENDDCRPFRIQGGQIERVKHYPPSIIPWWLAEIAYEDYSARQGPGCQSLERIAERGGFGRVELVGHIRGVVFKRLRKLISEMDIHLEWFDTQKKEYNRLCDEGKKDGGNSEPYPILRYLEGSAEHLDKTKIEIEQIIKDMGGY